MNDLPPLARRFREARDGVPTTNRKIALTVGVSSPTIDRLMNGDGRTAIETIDSVAQHLGVPLDEARRLADLPTTGRELYMGPSESRILSQRQRKALDELIRAMVAAPESEEQLTDTQPGIARPVDPGIVEASLLRHYATMFRRARAQWPHKRLVEQAWQKLGDARRPDMVVPPEIGNTLFIQYQAVRVASPAQGADQFCMHRCR